MKGNEALTKSLATQIKEFVSKSLKKIIKFMKMNLKILLISYKIEFMIITQRRPMIIPVIRNLRCEI